MEEAHCLGHSLARLTDDSEVEDSALYSFTRPRKLATNRIPGQMMILPRGRDEKGKGHESHGARQGFAGHPSPARCRSAKNGGDGSIQRGADQGRNHARRRLPVALFNRRSHSFLRNGPSSLRTAISRDQGAGKWLLDLVREIDGRGHHLVLALPEPDDRGFGSRDSTRLFTWRILDVSLLGGSCSNSKPDENRLGAKDS